MFGGVDSPRIKAGSLVLNAQLQKCALYMNLYGDANVARVLLDIPESLFADPVERGGCFGRNSNAIILNGFGDDRSCAVPLIVIT